MSGGGTGKDRARAGLSGFTTALLVMCAGLFGWAVLSHQSPGQEPRYGTLSPAPPMRLEVKSLRIKAPVDPVALRSDGVLDPPADPVRVGWWDGSARPGAPAGQTVITGHTVHTGGGSMDRLAQLTRGRTVDVVTREGRMRYQVQRVAVLSRQEVAARARTLFGQERPGGRLVLVSCTDWNGTTYESNVVVFARPLGEPARGKRPTRAG